MQDALRGANILVTGGGGFLGRHLLPVLVASGANITCLLRSPETARLPDGVRAIAGDCTDVRVMEKAAKAQDIIIHMAALLFGVSWQNYLAANASMAANVANSARESARRVIFISSLAAAGPAGTEPGKRETDPPEPVSAYGWSKLVAEHILQKSIGGRLVILRPPIIYGSGDRGLLPLFRSCAAGIGVSPGMREFPVSVIHAHDVARAILCVASSAAHGVYHLSDGYSYTMSGLCRAIGLAAGRSRVRVFKPPLTLMAASAGLASAGAAALQKMAHAFRRVPPRAPGWNLDKYREARQEGWLACSDRIKNELGFSAAMPPDKGMAEAISGYRQEGWL